MISTKALARVAGFLYLLVAVAGGFAESVRTSVVVEGSSSATAANVINHLALFRAAFIADLFDSLCFLGVGIALYALLRHVNPSIAVAMLVTNAVSVAIQAMNMLNHASALLAATAPGSSSLVLSDLELHRLGYLVAQIFFGAYLVPLGYLVYRSGYFPRVFGAILMVGSAGYLAGVAVTFATPTLQSGLAVDFGMVGGLAEIAFLLWLLVKGADGREREPGAAAVPQPA